MARLITHTNILVDDFDFCKSFPKKTFIHFLTHFHADHYEGLSPLWDYSHIYCTLQTKKFIQHKYPKIKNIIGVNYNQQYQIQLRQGTNIKVKFMFFDAKHIPGSAMILFEGYMGRIIFTGDFRYQFSMIQQNSYLFPLQNRSHHTKQQIVESMFGISLHIDQMIFDNTYCNKAFNFQTQYYIAQKMIKIIKQNSNKKLILIAMGALGKHKILLKIAEYFQTNIIVSQSQLQKIKVANLRTDFLTTDNTQGYIKLISKKKRRQIVEQTKKGLFGDSFICIDTDFLMLQHRSPDQINYIVPYSLHSNYQQMKTLIRLIKPSILRKIVIPYVNFKQIKLRLKIDHRLKFGKYLDFLQKKLHKSQSGYSQLVKDFTVIYELSEEYLKWFDKKIQKGLMDLLLNSHLQQNHNLRKRKVKLLQDQQLNFNNNSQSQTRSLKSIADGLNATNKNLTLQKCIKQGNQKKIEKNYEIKLRKFNLNKNINIQKINQLKESTIEQHQNQQKKLQQLKKIFLESLIDQNSNFEQSTAIDINSNSNNNNYYSIIQQQKQK